MRSALGVLLTIAGALIVLVAVVGGVLGIADQVGGFYSPQTLDFMPMIAAGAVLGGAFGVALSIIGARLVGGSGFLFQHIRALVTSTPVLAVEYVLMVLLFGLAAWFIGWTVYLMVNQPIRELAFNLMLGVPFGILIPLAAGAAIYAATHIPAAGDASTTSAVRLLAHVLTAFGVLWIAFAGVCTVTGGFSSEPGQFGNMESPLMQEAMVSLAFGAVFVAVGVWLRRITV